jgi:manganese/zinc/iron transport system permease protein
MNGEVIDRVTGVLFTPTPDDLWIVVVGALVAAACAIVGCFLVLNRMSMLGDAISHAVLPGIVLAFLWTGDRSIVPMLLGAGTLGILTTFITDVLHRQGRLPNDASIGVTFTVLFAIGVILVSQYAGQVDLDLDCVLYGEILLAPFDTIVINGADLGPRSAWAMGGVTLANLIFVTLAWKQLKVCAFDPAMAASMGISVVLWHYLLMGFVSMTTVAAFESVGVILVVGMLIVPPNTAYLLTDKLSVMLGLAVAFGVASAFGGYLLATAINGSIAGAMATVSGMLYVLAAVLGPRHGVLAKRLIKKRFEALESAA